MRLQIGRQWTRGEVSPWRIKLAHRGCSRPRLRRTRSSAVRLQTKSSKSQFCLTVANAKKVLIEGIIVGYENDMYCLEYDKFWSLMVYEYWSSIVGRNFICTPDGQVQALICRTDPAPLVCKRSRSSNYSFAWWYQCFRELSVLSRIPPYSTEYVLGSTTFSVYKRGGIRRYVVSRKFDHFNLIISDACRLANLYRTAKRLTEAHRYIKKNSSHV
jgi:hypothetical protein